VLFVSGYAEKAVVRGDFLDPDMDILTKPFALDELGAKVRNMIEHGPGPLKPPEPSDRAVPSKRSSLQKRTAAGPRGGARDSDLRFS
jgi:DNA-binding response OmpR family regulator